MRWPFVMLAVAAFVALDALLCWVFEPYGTVTQVAWHDYHTASAMDTVVVGSSYAQFSVNPLVLDPILGSTTYNLGTPAQSLGNSYAALKTAISDHHIRRALLCLEYESLPPKPWVNSAITFAQEKSQTESLPQVLGNVGDVLFDEHFFSHHYSLSCAFPWAYDHVALTPEAVSHNVQRRLTDDVYEAAADYSNETAGGTWVYQGQGYGATDFDGGYACTHGAEYAAYRDDPFDDSNLDVLRRICELCRANEVALYVIVPPTPASNLLEYGERYPTNMLALSQLVEKEGATYLDLNMLHRDVLDLPTTAFFDTTHLCLSGARTATDALAHLLQRVEAGEDVSGEFFAYDAAGWDAWKNGIDYVDSVDFEYEVAENATVVTALARTGQPSRVEYQFERLDPQTGDYIVVQPFGPTDSCTYDATFGDTLDLLIRARIQSDEDRHIESTIVV